MSPIGMDSLLHATLIISFVKEYHIYVLQKDNDHIPPHRKVTDLKQMVSIT